MLGNLQVRFGVGAGVRFPGPHHASFALPEVAYSIPLPPALCVSQERWPFPSLEVLRCGITKPRAIFFGNGSQRGVTDMTASR